MSRRVAGVLVAAGSGERLQRDEPKAFVPLAGRPLLLHAAAALLASGVVHELVVVTGSTHVEEAADLLRRAGVSAAVRAGGDSRSASVANGLAALTAGVDVVAVHDAARPLASPRLVARTVAALVPPWHGVAPAIPVVDTLKLVRADGGEVIRTVDRRDVWAVQTPQVFPRIVLERVHALRGVADATDDLLLIESRGGRVRLVEGERRNLKVTYPEDLVLAAALLESD